MKPILTIHEKINLKSRFVVNKPYLYGFNYEFIFLDDFLKEKSQPEFSTHYYDLIYNHLVKKKPFNCINSAYFIRIGLIFFKGFGKTDEIKIAGALAFSKFFSHYIIAQDYLRVVQTKYPQATIECVVS